MKTIEEVRAENEYANVYTFDEFADMVDDGVFCEYDGYGFFHDGESETDIGVFDDDIADKEVWQYPYVVWVNR